MGKKETYAIYRYCSVLKLIEGGSLEYLFTKENKRRGDGSSMTTAQYCGIPGTQEEVQAFFASEPDGVWSQETAYFVQRAHWEMPPYSNGGA